MFDALANFLVNVQLLGVGDEGLFFHQVLCGLPGVFSPHKYKEKRELNPYIF